ncbi:MAG: hypothetical protein Q7J68_02105 [Thermoplasmata archaeon]|nr:hypothetical protein [Thermoplasmata archaeon]
MKPKYSWKPGNRNAGRSGSTARKVNACTELFTQVIRSRPIAAFN